MSGEDQREVSQLNTAQGINPTLRAVLSDPPGEALAGAVNGVAGAVVGAEADLSAGPPVPATWTDCKS